ncbi:MAG: AAA family ATPase [Candidatus Accumulibacter sp.]|nr:AAA family ATPase [Accumulibacter sp.]
MAIRLSTTKESARDNGAKFLCHGPSGAGKTVLCGTTGAPTVIISAEAGLMSLRDHDIPVIEINTIEDLQEAYQFVTEAQEAKSFDWVCLDSISEIAEVCLAAEKRATKDPRAAYGALADKMGHIVRSFRDLRQKNVYFSCKQAREKDETTSSTLYVPALPGKMLTQGISYYFDFVFALRVERDAEGQPYRVLQTSRDFNYECKDRSGALLPFELPNLAAIAAKITTTS